MRTYKMEDLVNTIQMAIDSSSNYIGILIQMDGFEKNEIIINQTENFESKLAYYQKTYDENLNHKYSAGIRICDFTFGETFEDIQNDLI